MISALAASILSCIAWVSSSLLHLSTAKPTPSSARPRLSSPAFQLPSYPGLERLVDRDVDPLQHRGQHAARDAGSSGCCRRRSRACPCPLPPGARRGRCRRRRGRRRRRRDRTGSRASSSPLAGSFQAAGVSPVIVDEHLGLRIDVLHALLVAELEVADQRDVHAADEAHLAGLAGHGGGHADEERALVLLEDDGLDVRLVDHRVDDGEVGLGILGGELLERGGEGEADGDDDVGAATRHPAQRLVALALVRDLELEVADAGLLLELLGAVIGGLVEAACRTCRPCRR